VTERGAESEDYRRAGLPYAPRNGPFGSVEEVWQVLDMPRELRETLDSSLTVFTRQAGVDAQAAPPAVQAALAWADARQWQERRWLLGDKPEALSADRPAAGRVFRISSVARSSSASEALRARREAVVRITGNLRQPALIYTWDASRRNDGGA